MFFSALFPQFIDPAAPWLRTKGQAKIFNRVAELSFIGAGVLPASIKRMKDAR